MLEDLYKSPNALASHYSRFRVADRLLLTGHSHQAWPDCGFEGQAQAWTDAAEFVDDKWGRAFAKADRVRRGYARLLDDTDGYIALSSNTHDLVIRFLSALPLRARPRLVTTDGEYHSIRRQMDRLAEEGIEVVKVASQPAATVARLLCEAVDKRTSAVLVSSVFYHTGHIVPNLGDVLEACRRVGASLLIDAYHALNVAPFSIRRDRLDGAFVVGGGYKYCQLGEGNCFMRFPTDCAMRPVVTGWYSEFSALAKTKRGAEVPYGQGSDRFAGATYDPTSHYRAAEVFDFFERLGLTPERLREVSQHQIGLMARAFDDLDADPAVVTRDRAVRLQEIGGFLALSSPAADTLCERLRERGVSSDCRGALLRLGPAPYLSDRQLTEAMRILGDVIRDLSA
jgi:kynureninase